MNPYLPVLILLIFTIAFGTIVSLTSWLVGPRKYNKSKHETYECGVPLVTSARERMSVKFYLTAILFILFDIETIFLYLWAKVFSHLSVTSDLKVNWFGFTEILLFILVLFVGYIYVVRKGALEWD